MAMKIQPQDDEPQETEDHILMMRLLEENRRRGLPIMECPNCDISEEIDPECPECAGVGVVPIIHYEEENEEQE